MNFLAIIQARIDSSRLPGKVLLPLGENTVLEHVISRVRKSAFLNENTVVATSISKSNLPIVKLCAEIGVQVFCGSEDNVLDRFYQLSKLLNPENIVRITADCPLIDPSVIDEVIGLHLSSNSDYTTNTIEHTYPDGEDVEVFKFSALKKAWEDAALPSEHEHVTPYIWKRPEIFKLCNLKSDKNLGNMRWTIDNIEDYDFIKNVYKHLFNKNEYFGMFEIIEFLKNNPEIEKINSHICRNEGYINSLKNDIKNEDRNKD